MDNTTFGDSISSAKAPGTVPLRSNVGVWWKGNGFISAITRIIHIDTQLLIKTMQSVN